MHDGCILCGGVGSGKSITGLAYYFCQMGGEIGDGCHEKMSNPLDIYIITTAHKRDLGEWEIELTRFGLSTKDDKLYPGVKVVVDSWNNIGKYISVKGAFFIFDEQRVVGSGEWVKSYLKICKSNRWILLSATPGDTWMDYIPVFIANGFYRNKSDFTSQHCHYNPYCKWPQVDKYYNVGRLIRLRKRILVQMDYQRPAECHHINFDVGWDQGMYRSLMRDRWDIWKDEPMQNAAQLCYCLRRCVNEAVERQIKLLEICESHPKVIIFYNYDYELEILKGLGYLEGTVVAEWNGHQHQDIPDKEARWVYLVQYNAGAEGWNCTLTDTMVFFSQNYSYKMMVQAAGRIDRSNTPFRDLYFYHLVSKSQIDMAIGRALKSKKKFNEAKFIGEFTKNE